jgi:hypothetical protein
MYYLLLFSLFLMQLSAYSQGNANAQWTWVKGDSTENIAGIYGIKGTASDQNKPGAREGSVSWKDESGNLWLFAGRSSNNDFNDLWKFNPATNQWAWISGDSTKGVAGIYGIQGIEDSANQPGARSFSTSWIDLNGNFWLFGGAGYSNDLWKYNPVTNLWTWVKGDSTKNVGGTYGIQGVANEANTPGARYGSVSWTDASGNLWLYGGRGYLNTGSLSLTNLSDLWKYNISTNQWTWVSGSNSGIVTPVYGTKGVPSPSNQPGGRYGSAAWVDTSGNFWLFGGELFYPISINYFSYNDLWMYNTATSQWVWMHGDNTRNNVGIYGTQGVANDDNKPGGRYNAATWTDNSNNLWLFGGQCLYSPANGGLSVQYEYNDLWQYNITARQWTWQKGSNIPDSYGIYGTQNVTGATNKPGARLSAVSWFDSAGHLWLFGGKGFAASKEGFLNDLWKLNDIHILPVGSIRIFTTLDNNMVNVHWQTSSETNTAYFVVERSANSNIFIPLGAVKAAGISSATKKYLFPDQEPYLDVNYYRIKIVDKDGKSAYSSVVKVVMQTVKDVTVYPNPVKDVATIHLRSSVQTTLEWYLYDRRGQVVRANQVSVIHGNNSFTIDMSTLPKGVYFCTLKWGGVAKNVKVLKQ